ncbi:MULTISPECIES: acyltransferase [unclassified Sphingobacterium]|uniref:acyltransferase n=1 Tax=unclassified Sphingobacterium TaxID=2609468 RepID=UPI0020C31EC0|nr:MULTISPECIES: acyltransferase [unclassified Sphingobacterium]
MFSLIYNKIQKVVLNRNLKHLKSFGINNDISIGCRFLFPENIQLGSNIYIGPNAEVNGLGGIIIKDGVIIGPNLIIHSANHNYKDSKYLPYDELFEFRKVIINENVWIGGNVIVVPGAEIGEGCIVGAGTVVSGKIPPLSIIVGNPCKIIKQRDSEHYFKLKNNNQIYMKYKKENLIIK